MSATDHQQGSPPPIEGAEHRFIDAAGLRVHYAEAGTGPPLLCLHGWPQHHYMWRGIFARLKDRFRLIAPDLRGFGWTEAPGHGYDGETFARDQVALLDALGIDRAGVIGHDWGGWTTFLLGIEHPSRIDRAVVLSSPHPWPPMSPMIALEQLPRAFYALLNAAPGVGTLLHERTSMVSTALRRASAAGTFDQDETEIYAAAFRDPARARAVSSLYRYYLRQTRQGFSGGAFKDRRLTVPTLLMVGDRDPAFSSRLFEGWQAHADDMTLEWLGARHFVVDELPDEVASRAAGFLAPAVP